MESILARALEYTLKYWLKSFTRDQFKLQGRTVQLSNLDINGDALHASVGLPPALSVTTAKVGKLEIILPSSVSNVQVEPIIVQIDKLDLVLKENDDFDASKTTSSPPTSTTSTKGSGYGFADKIADGMTIQIGTVNLMLETHGSASRRGGATWASPMASITIRNLSLCTTNENWQIVDLKTARDFSNEKEFIYVFKKLEWESLCIDLLPHPDMFSDALFESSQNGSHTKDEDGAKRVFFGGERFIEGISGEAYITIQRTSLNSALGLEVQLHITEAVCPALSEPGLRALLRFLTGLYVCLNRGDVKQNSTEAAGRSLVSMVIDHIFLCIKDVDFQLELLMQSLMFSRASVSDGESAKYLTRVMIGGLFLRETFSRPPCALVQPMMQANSEETYSIPEFGKNFCPPIYPLGDEHWKLNCGVPLISLHSLQLKPTPNPPTFASQTVIECQPLMIHLHEDSCLRIASFLADGIVVNHGGAILPDFSINTLAFNLKQLDITVPLDTKDIETNNKSSFSGAKLHVQDLFFYDSPILKLNLLNLEKEPACFSLWKDQPIDSSQKKLTGGTSEFSISLETSVGSTDLWRCIELKGFCFEVAMATSDGSTLTNIPPPGGVIRVGVTFDQFLSNSSVEQLFFVLEMYTYFGHVSEKIAIISKNSATEQIIDISDNTNSKASLMEKVPGDTAMSLSIKEIKLRFLESSSSVPLVQFIGENLFTKFTHRTLGGAIDMSSILKWERIEVDCAENDDNTPRLRSVLWVNKNSKKNVPFIDVNFVHMIPFNAQDMECHSLRVYACITGLRLGGGMSYAEALLHKFGILGPDGGPGKGLTKGLEHLSSGPLSNLFKSSPLNVDEVKENTENGDLGEDKDGNVVQLGSPDDVDITIELNDWLFALEGAQDIAEKFEDSVREDRSWHTNFESICVKTQSKPKNVENNNNAIHKYPVELITVAVESLQILKPLTGQGQNCQSVDSSNGVNFEAGIAISKDDLDEETPKWVVENMKFSVKQPIEAVVTKDELEYLTILCKSEINSMGRITALVLRLLKLEKSIGPQAISQLSNLGSEGFDNIFSPGKISRGSSASNSASNSAILLSPSKSVTENGKNSGFESIVCSLDEVIQEAQIECAALSTKVNVSESLIGQVDHVKELRHKLASMQKLLQNLRSQM